MLEAELNSLHMDSLREMARAVEAYALPGHEALVATTKAVMAANVAAALDALAVDDHEACEELVATYLSAGDEAPADASEPADDEADEAAPEPAAPMAGEHLLAAPADDGQPEYCLIVAYGVSPELPRGSVLARPTFDVLARYQHALLTRDEARVRVAQGARLVDDPRWSRPLG